MYLRCFIAVDIPGQIKGDIGKLIEILRKHNADVKWVLHENLHLTLKFLGKTPEDLLPKISESLSEIVLSYTSFCIKIYSAGVFPNRKYPRVIWVGMEDSEVLKKMQRDIDDSMAALGYQKEERVFYPHLTIGRVRSQKGMMTLIHELDNFKEIDFGNIEVYNIKLMKSELRPTGAQYFCLQEIPLGRGKDER
ncbi:MAG TPA: RNA 2',3'-cyclic phosphodiesterase [Thermodesulfovibrionales bacterium]|nr:RNA 2',3'-cyclic phosphodiesterase [Thermodesulfovibrionales bacterium]